MIRRIELVLLACLLAALAFMTFTCGSEDTPGATGPSNNHHTGTDSDSDSDADSDSDSDSDSDTHNHTGFDGGSGSNGGFVPPDFDLSNFNLLDGGVTLDGGLDDLLSQINLGAIDCDNLPAGSLITKAQCNSLIDSFGNIQNPFEDAIAQAQEAIKKGQATVQQLQDAVQCTQDLQTKITQFNDAGVLDKLKLIGPLTAKITECTNKWNAIGK